MSKKITTGVIAIVLIAALLLCGVITVGAVGVTYPQSGAAGDTVYVKNAANWGKVFAYMWNNNDDKNAVWPGQEMTPIGDGVYSYKITGNWANIIFNHGNDGNKTADMVLGSNGGRIFNNSTNSWGDYAAATTPGTTVTTPNITAPIVTQAPTPGSGTVFFKNESGWSSVNAYMWNTEDDEESAWPGKAMTNIGDNIWQYNYSGNWKNIIFNKGSGGDGNQTGDLVLPGSGSIYISGSNSWDVYDTSPLIIKSFTADLASPQYKGTAIVLSASAQTQSGTAIYYKFSAKGASTTVLQDFSTNSSVIWIPSATGSYTLTLDVKDAAGNTNTRQITYSVLDDTNVAKPIIKMVTPYSGTTLKANTAANFAVTASGGKVGTNLLFYKYIVKNASGTVINTPYYTRNATYSFTPTTLGAYTVQVFVQASDNATLNQTYSYTVANNGSVSTTPPATPPTSTQPASTTTPSITTQPITTPPAITQQPTPSAIVGDANNDGSVTIEDVTSIQKYLAVLLTERQINLTLADANRDGSVNVEDATTIQKYLAQLITQF